MGRLILTGVMLLMLTAGVASASPHGLFDRAPGIYPLADISPDRVAALSAGKPPGLAGLGSWVTSDFEPDDFTTNFYWCDFENLYGVQLFNVSSLANIKASIKVTAPNGTVVYTENYPITPDGPGIYYFYATPSTLPAGNYKVTIKIVQGQKAVGSQYWIVVLDGDSPDCSFVAADPAATR